MIIRRRSQTKAIRENTSWLTSSRFFQKLVDRSFEVVDADQSGDVTLDELYAGLLLIHLRLAVYVGAPACRVSDGSEVFYSYLIICSLFRMRLD